MRAVALVAIAAVLALSACQRETLTDEQKKVIQSLSIDRLAPLPADPTNAVADEPRAAALGATLFNDTSFSRDGRVACGTCHVAEKQFQDQLPLGVGVGVTNRRTMPLTGVAWSPWLFWDGRKDSLWSQALGPVESQVEHGVTRVFVARRIAEAYRPRYESLFGPMPDLSATPASAGPFGTNAEKAAWTSMSEADREAVNRVYANFGKAIAAFERSLVFPETRFDRYAKALASGRPMTAEAALEADELEGFKLFVSKGRCINCHNGPRFTDDHFHNTGIPPADDLPDDTGRADGAKLVAADEFNCLGRYSDGKESDCGELKFMVRQGEELVRAFKTPSLRGVAGRPPYMHAGQIGSLEAALQHYSAAPPAPAGHSELEAANFTTEEKAALIAFLKTLGK